jgi:hypothetical protein
MNTGESLPRGGINSPALGSCRHVNLRVSRPPHAFRYLAFLCLVHVDILEVMKNFRILVFKKVYILQLQQILNRQIHECEGKA